MISLPSNSISLANNDYNLLIPQDKLEATFNIHNNLPEVQVPTKIIYISQGFSIFHPGIDLASEIGTPIKPVMKGIVKEAGFSTDGYGNRIIIDHGNGIESLYAHLSKIEVKRDEEVDLNTEIGLIGSTGHSTGPHLHLEIHKNGKPINPINFLPKFTKEDLLATVE